MPLRQLCLNFHAATYAACAKGAIGYGGLRHGGPDGDHWRVLHSRSHLGRQWSSRSATAAGGGGGGGGRRGGLGVPVRSSGGVTGARVAGGATGARVSEAVAAPAQASSACAAGDAAHFGFGFGFGRALGRGGRNLSWTP